MNGKEGNNKQKSSSIPTAAERRIVGTVTLEECEEIKLLYERKNGLVELFRTFTGMSNDELESSPLYNKVVNDMGTTSTKFQQWWDDKALKYNWENIPGMKWEIDFATGTIFIRRL